MRLGTVVATIRYRCVSVCTLEIDKANNYKRRYEKKVWDLYLVIYCFM